MNNSQPLDSYKGLHGKINNTITPDTFKRGIISAVHIASNTADVNILGNNASIVKNVPLSSAINPFLVQAGDKCQLWMFDATNPNDCVVTFTYGRKAFPLVTSGMPTVTFTAGVYHAVPHNLGMVPNLYMVSPNFSYTVSSGYVTNIATINLSTLKPPDNINLYVISQESGPQTFYWLAAYYAG
jgi:hypothetical protein